MKSFDRHRSVTVVVLLLAGLIGSVAGCRREAGQSPPDKEKTARPPANESVAPSKPASSAAEPPAPSQPVAASEPTTVSPGAQKPAEPAATGKPPAPADASEIIERFIQTCGGREAFGRLRNRVINGTYELGPQKGHMTIYEAEPNKAYVYTLWEDGTSSEVWSNGDIIWDRGSSGATRIRQGLDREEHLFRTWFNREIRWQDLHKSAELLGVEEVEGKRYYKVRVEPIVGAPETWYINEQTGLHERSESTDSRNQAQQSVKIPVVTVFSDYRKVDGVLRYHRLEQTYGFRKMIVTFDTMQHNLDLDSTLFEVPAAISEMQSQGLPTKLIEAGKNRLVPGDPRFESEAAMAPTAKGGEEVP
jgi:hypothetical protein